MRCTAATEFGANALTSKFSQNRVDYTLVNTATPLDYALFKYLSARQRLSRVR